MKKEDIIRINYMSPIVNRFEENKLQLLFSDYSFQIAIGREAFNFDKSDGREIIVNIKNKEIENKEETFAFRSNKRTIYITLQDLHERTVLQDRVNRIIREHRNSKITMYNVKIFEERAYHSVDVVKGSVFNIGTLMFSILVSCLALFLIMGFGMIILGVLIGQVSAYWLGSLIALVFIYQYRYNLYHWFMWQFIEPFKDYSDDEKN